MRQMGSQQPRLKWTEIAVEQRFIEATSGGLHSTWHFQGGLHLHCKLFQVHKSKAALELQGEGMISETS